MEAKLLDSYSPTSPPPTPTPLKSVSSPQQASSWPQGYKTSFMLNSAEHEIFSANKYENANNSWHFHIY